MSDFNQALAKEFIAACKEGESAIVTAFEKAFEITNVKPTLGEPTSWTQIEEQDWLLGEGQVITWSTAAMSVAMVIPAGEDFPPDWAAMPDTEPREKRLASLPNDLSDGILPESMAGAKGELGWCVNLRFSLEAGKLAKNSVVIPISIVEPTAKVYLIGPFENPAAIFQNPTEEELAEPTEAPAGTAKKLESEFDRLPPYARSLLKIRLPVRVTLASTKQSVQRVQQLGPGSILQFDRSCEESLTLEVGDHQLAEGEAVRVGEQFGLRISAITPPQERFEAVTKR